MGVQHRSGMYLEARLPLAFIARGMQSEERIQSRPTVTKRSTRFFCRGVSIRVTTSRDIKPSEGWHGMATGMAGSPTLCGTFNQVASRRGGVAWLGSVPLQRGVFTIARTLPFDASEFGARECAVDRTAEEDAAEIIWSAQKRQSRSFLPSFLSTSGNDSPLFPSSLSLSPPL